MHGCHMKFNCAFASFKRQACFLTCWLKISAGKSVEFSKLHKILYFSFRMFKLFFFLWWLDRPQRVCKFFFAFPFKIFYFPLLFRKFHTFSVRHAESAYLRSKYTRMHISSSHVCFAALCDGILGINNISQFSGIITGKLSIVYMSLPLLPVLQLFPSNISRCQRSFLHQ